MIEAHATSLSVSALTIMAATLQRDIAGQPTQIVLQTFADRILILVTQVGKVGNLVSVTIAVS